jgi:membrane-associated protease RseP (regulator of RpoE activity)
MFRKHGLTSAMGVLVVIALVVWTVPTTAAPAPDSAPKKEEPKKDAAPKQVFPEFPFPDLEKLLPPGAIDPEQMKELQKMMDDIRKQIQQMRGIQRGAVPGGIFPGGRGARNFLFGRMDDMEDDARFGARIQKPSDTLVDQLNLPQKQGIVLQEIRPDSAAAKAGLKDHDILLELNGKPVPSDMDEFGKLVQDIKPDTAVDAVVLRKGKKETIKGLKLPEAKEEPNNPFRNLPRFQIFPQQGGFPFPGGVLGVQPGNTRIIRNGDGSFTASFEQNGVKVSVTGKTEKGMTRVDEIEVNDGKEAKKYKSVDETPEAHRETARNLIRMIEAGRGFRFNFRNIP